MYHFLYIPKFTNIILRLWLQIFTSRQPAFPANKLTDHQHTKAHGSILTTCRRAERLAPLLCLPLCNHWRWTAAPDVRWNQCNGYLNRWEEEQSLLLLSSHEEILLKAEWTKEFIYLSIVYVSIYLTCTSAVARQVKLRRPTTYRPAKIQKAYPHLKMVAIKCFKHVGSLIL